MRPALAVIDLPSFVTYFVFVTSFLWLRVAYFVTTSEFPARSLSVWTILYFPAARILPDELRPDHW